MHKYIGWSFEKDDFLDWLFKWSRRIEREEGRAKKRNECKMERRKKIYGSSRRRDGTPAR